MTNPEVVQLMIKIAQAHLMGDKEEMQKLKMQIYDEQMLREIDSVLQNN